MVTIPKVPQISPINGKVTSGLESGLPNLSPSSRKPIGDVYRINGKEERMSIRTEKIKTLLRRKLSNTSAIVKPRRQDGDFEPEIPSMIEHPTVYNYQKEEFNRTKSTAYKGQHSYGERSYYLFGSIYRNNSAIEPDSFDQSEYIHPNFIFAEVALPVRYREQSVKVSNCLDMDMRPGEMFKIARDAPQRSISQGRSGLHVKNQRSINQRGSSFETTDVQQSFGTTQTFGKSGLKERPVESKNQVLLPALGKKAVVQEEILINGNKSYLNGSNNKNKPAEEDPDWSYGSPPTKKRVPVNLTPRPEGTKKEDQSEVLARRNTTEPGHEDRSSTPFTRKIYNRGENSAFITPTRKNKSPIYTRYEDSSILQDDEMNSTFDGEYLPMVKKERLPKAITDKLEEIERERVRLGLQKGSDSGPKAGTTSYFDAKYSWSKAIEVRRQKPGYNSKSRNIKGIDHLLRLKTRIGHPEKMQEYLRRRGLNENTKVFCFNSKDLYIKRILEGLGWIENPNIDSPLFDLKWAYRDVENDYQLLSEGQFFNHFGNNRALTMKSELIKNLRDNCEVGSEWSFFPRAYELGHGGQSREFKEDFERTMLGNLIKKLWEYVKARCERKIVEKAKVKFWVAHRAKEKRKSKKQRRIEFEKFGKEILHKKAKMYRKYGMQKPIKATEEKKRTKWDEINFEEVQHREDFMMHSELVIQTLRCLRTLIKQQKAKIVMEEDDFYLVADLPTRIRDALMKYSQADHGSARIVEEVKAAPNVILDIWKTPNQDIINLIYKYYSLLKLSHPQFKIDGSKNVWIVKPGGNSRGSGIFLVNSLEEALENRTRNQSRIIQKYIERPLILWDFPINEINGKKFDLRQWVLVTSVNPLTVYMFSSCYLRICSTDFDLQDLKNNYRHLTNFSVNKHNYGRNAENSVCKVEYLKDYLKYSRNIEWDSYIKPQITNIILKTLACVSDDLEHRNNCFELYGFDILLDETCKAWLLEVNLSPACSERAPWLMIMLDQMGLEMLKLVLPANYLGDIDAYRSKERSFDNGDVSSDQEASDYMRWELISKDEFAKETKDLIVNPVSELEVVGTKLNWKKEQIFDKKHDCYRLVMLLQKNIKAFLFRKSIQRRIRNTKAKMIQRRVRRFLARVRYIKRIRLRALENFKKFMIKSLKAKFFTRFIQTNASVIIQRHVKHRLKYLKERRIKGLKILERGVAKFYGRRLLCGLRQTNAAVTIQKYIKKRQRIRRERREKGLNKLKVTLLKPAWQKLLEEAKRQNAAISIQNQFRRWKTKKEEIKMQKEREALKNMIEEDQSNINNDEIGLKEPNEKAKEKSINVDCQPIEESQPSVQNPIHENEQQQE